MKHKLSQPDKEFAQLMPATQANYHRSDISFLILFCIKADSCFSS